jgi:type IV pilus assembly protein PilQ
MNRAEKAASRRRNDGLPRWKAACCALALLLVSAEGHAQVTPNHVHDVKVHAAAGAPGGTEIEISGSMPPTYSARVADGGKQLLVDLSNSDVVGTIAPVTQAAGLVGGVLTQGFKTEAGSMTRISVSLLKPANYRVHPEGTTLHITLLQTGAVASGPSTLSTASADAAKPGAPAVSPSVASPADSAPHATGVAPQVKDVRFERLPVGSPRCPLGCDRVVLGMTAVPSYALTTTEGGHVRLELKGTQVIETAAKTIDVSSYRGALRTVASFHDGTTDMAILEIDRAGDQQGNVAVDGTQLSWSFDLPHSRIPSPIRNAEAVRRTVTVAREDAPPDLPKVETSIHGGDDGAEVQTTAGSEAGFTSTVAAQNAPGTGRYSGRRIDLDLKDADIHNILRLLADVGHVNIVTADDVSGTVTIRMRNVPWDQALDVVLQAKSLGMVRAGNLIRVAPAAVLNRERELRIAQLKQELELTPLETRLIPVSYAHADELQARAKDMLSPRGSLAVDERTNVLIARDIPGNLNHLEELVRALDTQTPQVLVEARIVEATSQYLRDVGIQWGGDVSFSPATGNPTGIAFPSSVTASGGNYDQNSPTAGVSPFERTVPQPNFAVNLPAAVGTGAGGALGLSFGAIDNTIHLNTRLSAAESSGLVRIVSSPRILTLDNHEARINQGTLLPFSQVSAQGVQTTFQEAKLQLLVRPHVTADGSILMHVKLNRDEPDFTHTSARGDPTILKREAETELLVMDGHTAVIGGIFTRNTGRNLDQIPFFGDIPIIGILFQRRRASDSRNELVIFLTPRIVNRAEALGR